MAVELEKQARCIMARRFPCSKPFDVWALFTKPPGGYGEEPTIEFAVYEVKSRQQSPRERQRIIQEFREYFPLPHVGLRLGIVSPNSAGGLNCEYVERYVWRKHDHD